MLTLYGLPCLKNRGSIVHIINIHKHTNCTKLLVRGPHEPFSTSSWSHILMHLSIGSTGGAWGLKFPITCDWAQDHSLVNQTVFHSIWTVGVGTCSLEKVMWWLKTGSDTTISFAVYIEYGIITNSGLVVPHISWRQIRIRAETHWLRFILLSMIVWVWEAITLFAYLVFKGTIVIILNSLGDYCVITTLLSLLVRYSQYIF